MYKNEQGFIIYFFIIIFFRDDTFCRLLYTSTGNEKKNQNLGFAFFKIAEDQN